MLLCAPGAARAQTEGDEDLLREARAFSEFSSSAVAMRDSIVALARAQIGTPVLLI